MSVKVFKAEMEHLDALAGLALALWPDNTLDDFKTEFGEMIPREDAACFLAAVEDSAVGFAQCQLRRDYVEGTETSPVGYLEGIFVAEAYRRQGAAKALVAACEAWARQQGCGEFASDCQLDNAKSLQFHLGVGFQEANRIICFTKKL